MSTTEAVKAKAADIRLAVFDVDGVMTDGRLYLGPDGAEFKSVHIHDGLGLQRLQAVDITPAAISGRPSRAIENRLLDLGLQYIYLDVEDKPAAFAGLLDDLGLDASQAAVMGDDLPDLPLMRRAGLALAVADALPELRAAADWISTLPGGAGAVREACELLIAAREDET